MLSATTEKKSLALEDRLTPKMINSKNLRKMKSTANFKQNVAENRDNKIFRIISVSQDDHWLNDR